jgi:1,4-alpha-glucan branching enzyme
MRPNRRNPYDASHNIRARNFICNAPEAKHVSLVGDFNHWSPRTHPMQRGADGAWTIRVELKHGHHRYAYHVDGELVLDPQAMGITRDDQGQRVSLIAVS